jgi:hypothetical protein
VLKLVHVHLTNRKDVFRRKLTDNGIYIYIDTHTSTVPARAVSWRAQTDPSWGKRAASTTSTSRTPAWRGRSRRRSPRSWCCATSASRGTASLARSHPSGAWRPSGGENGGCENPGIRGQAVRRGREAGAVYTPLLILVEIYHPTGVLYDKSPFWKLKVMLKIKICLWYLKKKSKF